MRETGVVTVPGSGFGQRAGTQHFRLVLLPDVQTIEEACEGIGRFMSRSTPLRGDLAALGRPSGASHS
jgi:alanine-synthesizing transaminase